MCDGFVVNSNELLMNVYDLSQDEFITALYVIASGIMGVICWGSGEMAEGVRFLKGGESMAGFMGGEKGKEYESWEKVRKENERERYPLQLVLTRPHTHKHSDHLPDVVRDFRLPRQFLRGRHNQALRRPLHVHNLDRPQGRDALPFLPNLPEGLQRHARHGNGDVRRGASVQGRSQPEG